MSNRFTCVQRCPVLHCQAQLRVDAPFGAHEAATGLEVADRIVAHVGKLREALTDLCCA
ncbi:hypothetical protein D3C79_783030 [compost metagenome]